MDILRREPTINEIYWTAGIYEGEGNIASYDRNRKTAQVGLHCSISQQHRWVLEQIQTWFGGNISFMDDKSGIYKLRWTGPKARDFICSIAPLLSPRRLHQARLHIGRYNTKEMAYAYPE